MDFNALIGRTVKHKKFGDGCIIEIDNSYVCKTHFRSEAYCYGTEI